MITAYLVGYLNDMDQVLAAPDRTSAERLMAYWEHWRETQSTEECPGKCLAVKLGAEVADLSEAMRLALKDGTTAIVSRLERVITSGVEDGSLAIDGDAGGTAQVLYDLWLGASVMAKIHRSLTPLDTTMAATRQFLHL